MTKPVIPPSVTRRTILSRVGVLAAAPLYVPALRTGPTRVAEAATAPSAEPKSKLSLILSFAGDKSLRFDQKDATRLGDYVGEHVRQQCYVQRKDMWTVFFRPDADGAHEEIVIERGRMSLEPGQAATHIVEPYSAIILRDDQRIAQVAVPYHWWWSRWRWQSSPRPVVRRPADLIKAKLLPPYGPSMLYGLPPYGNPPVYDAPMSSAGIARAMASPGDRPDIGVFTEPQADFIIRETPTALEALLAQGEAAGSMPIHWRDEKTGAFIDFQRRPYMTTYYREEGPKKISTPPPLPRAPGQKADQSYDERYWGMETSHTPNVAYLPYILTDDPYFLEETQALANLGIGWSNYHQEIHKLPGLIYPGEPRSFAWSFRDLFEAALVSPASPPSWLLGKEYFRQCIGDCRKYARLYQDSPARVHKIFHAFTMGGYVSSWQDGYIGGSLGFARFTGAFPEWDDFYVWFMQGMLPMATDGSGWSKAVPMAYYYHPIKGDNEALGLVSDTRFDSVTSPTWADAYATWKTTAGPQNGPIIGFDKQPVDFSRWNGDSIIPLQSDATMYLNVQGAFRLAKINNVPGADKAAAWMDHCMPALIDLYRGGGRGAKWSIGG